MDTVKQICFAACWHVNEQGARLLLSQANAHLEKKDNGQIWWQIQQPKPRAEGAIREQLSPQMQPKPARSREKLRMSPTHGIAGSQKHKLAASILLLSTSTRPSKKASAFSKKLEGK